MLRLCLLTATAVLAMGGAALAGSANTLYLLQDSTVRPDLGNSLDVDQTAAGGSLIGTGLVPATQKGALNGAMLRIIGNGGTIQLYQDNASFLAPAGNTAEVNVSNGGSAAVVQLGDGNDALLTVQGFSAGGLITQLGDDNLAEVDARGTLAIGAVVQNGDGNSASLEVRGFSAVTYIQNGNNLQSLYPATVWSNAGPIVITQSAF